MLVQGAAGGVGSASCNMAAALGARVIAVVSSTEKVAIAEAAGAHHVVLADGFAAEVRQLTDGRGVDVIVDPVGGERFTDSLRSLAREGRLLVVGFAGGQIPVAKTNRLLLTNTTVMGAGNQRAMEPRTRNASTAMGRTDAPPEIRSPQSRHRSTVLVGGDFHSYSNNRGTVSRRQGTRTRSLARVCQSTSNNSTLAWSGNRRTNPLPCALRSSANRDNRITGAGLGIAGVGHIGPPAPGRGTRFATLAEKLNSLACGASFPTTIHRRQAVMTRDSVVLDDRDDMAREKMPPLVPTVLGRDVHLGLTQDSPPR